MAVSYGPSLVTSGLVTLLDASNPRSYTGAGTTINDLSGAGATGTLNGAGGWVSNGAASYWNFATASISNYISSVLAQNYLDCCLIFMPDFAVNNQAALVNTLGSGTSSDYTIRFNGANGVGPWAAANNNANDWVYPTQLYYINGGIYTASVNLPAGWNIYGSPRSNTSYGAFTAPFAYTWGTGYPGRYFQGKLAYMALYNRKLSAVEQLQNFNALRGRFGL